MTIGDMRLLYGYEFRGAKPVIVPREAAVVRAVLAAGPGAHASAVLAVLDRPESDHTIWCWVNRITKRRKEYLSGQAHAKLKPDPSLIIAPEPVTV